MILVDTSVLIDLLKGKSSTPAACLNDRDFALMAPIVGLKLFDME